VIEANGHDDLPSGWALATLEDCVEILDGQRIPINSEERDQRIAGRSSSELVPYYGATGQVGWIDGHLFDEELVLLGEDGAPFLEPSKNKAYLIKGKSWVNNHAHVLRALHQVTSNRFLCPYLNGFDFHGYVAGTTRLKLNQAPMRRIPIHLPPFPEQLRIVAKIEELFTKLDAAIAELRKAQKQLKRYRQSVLNAAITGELTKAWREAHERELETAAELLARVLKRRRENWETDQLVKMEIAGKTPKGDDWKTNYHEPQPPTLDGMPTLPDEWKWARLDALAAIKGGIAKNAGRRIRNGRTIPYLRVANVQRGYLDLAEIKVIEATEAEIAELQLQSEDILFTEGGDRDKLGRGWVWQNELPECIHQNHIFRGRLFVQEMSARFISFFSNTFGLDYFLREGKQTTNLASINHTKLSGLPVPVPSSEEQSRIVEEIERCFSIADAIQQTIEQSLKQAERMRQSILKQAFEGKLVPQDPNNEPAKLLLERIKIERAKREAEKSAASKPNQGRFRKKQNKQIQGAAA